MNHNCPQEDCNFNDEGICVLSFESEEDEPWEDYGTKRCKKEVDYSMANQVIYP